MSNALLQHQSIKYGRYFSDEQLQRIMPQLEKHQLIEGSPNRVGSKYAQQNRIAGRLVSYVMEITAYTDLPEQKRKTSILWQPDFSKLH
ncbi:hypothetical protein [Planococcus faecalis]|uniref:hypothetical protein n=1 Tax=Planococcus faecalis TaxID=1598147 RepID=UPI002108E3D8|nr:hypothetical protein [Planococcus faecalis]